MADNTRELILKLFREKALLKNEVGEKILAGFKKLKNILSKLQDELRSSMAEKIPAGMPITYFDKGDFQADFTIADDTIIFLMHSNVFTFESNHEIWKSSYIQEDSSRSYCGKISVYNFLSDSFKYNRTKDIGYLIARIFINKENHFFVEGKRQLGFLYNDFANAEFNAEAVKQVAESAILYSLDFDPYTPPYAEMAEISVQDILDSTSQSKIITGKRLGFRFQADTNNPF